MTSLSYGDYKDGADVFTTDGPGARKFELQLMTMKIAFETNSVAEKKILSTGASTFEYCNLDGGKCVYYRRVEVTLGDDGESVEDFVLYEGTDKAKAEPVEWVRGSENMVQGDRLIAELNNRFAIKVPGARGLADETCIYFEVENMAGGELSAYPGDWRVRTVDDLELNPTSYSDRIELTSMDTSKLAEVCFAAPADEISVIVLPTDSVFYDSSTFAEETQIVADWEPI